MICPYCVQEMTEGLACTFEPENRIPNEDIVCLDCGVPPHALHHPGCGTERCHHTYPWNGTILHAQAISCPFCVEEQCARDGHEYGDPDDDGDRNCRWCGELAPRPLRPITSKEELLAVLRHAHAEFAKLDPDEQEFLRRELIPPYPDTDDARQR